MAKILLKFKTTRNLENDYNTPQTPRNGINE